MKMEQAPYYIPAHEWEATDALPEPWRWQPAWKFVKRLRLTNSTLLLRDNEPVEIDVDFFPGQIADAERELRVLEVATDGSDVREVPSQSHQQPGDSETTSARVIFLASLGAEAERTYLLFYGNPQAPPPAYDTDLVVTGQGYDLTIDNPFYRIVLAPTMGQIKHIYYKTISEVSHEPSPSILGFGPPMDGGHGVEGTTHWGPDWSDEHTGRYRITSWEEAPNYSVLRGPVCLRLIRWGHPILALGPGVGRTDHVTTTVSYTFFASSPYFLMESRMEVNEDVRFRDCRNDEWVGMIPALPEIAWMERNGTIGQGPRSWKGEDPAWMTYYNRTTRDGFASIHLLHDCSHPAWQEPYLVSINASSMRQRTRGGWVRYPLRHATMHTGDYVHERNAYLLHRYKPSRGSGFGMLEDYHRRLTVPLEQLAATPTPKALTRDNVMDALRGVYDHELYIEGTLFGDRLVSVVDMGLIRGLVIAGEDVTIQLIMPYRGRESWFDWFASSIETKLRARLTGIGCVDVQLVREPAWSPHELSARARRLMNLEDGDINPTE
jgi:metal-sulfur cluster biosynthetic enzyme